MERSLWSVLFGTFTLRFSTGLTGALLIYYLADLPKHGGQEVDAIQYSLIAAAFFATELALSPFLGVLSDRFGHHRVMQLGPIFGFVAVILTGLSTNLWVLGGTRLLEGASTAASVPSILGFIAMATAHDEALRGRTSSRFEAATITGIGAGIAAAGVAYQVFGALAFFINAGIYVVSLLIYRYGVLPADAAADSATADATTHHTGLTRYLALLRTSHVWLLAPTWIAINAALGLYTGQSLFQLVKKPDPRFADQLLVGGFEPWQVTVGFIAAGVFFFAGLVYWGGRFKDMRRTTIILYGLGGGVLLVACALLINHSAGMSVLVQLPAALGVGVGVFVLAGATPAALGLLADISEAFPTDRGAIMGLYSVFLGIGQIIGSLIGGLTGERWAFDGILVATFVLMGIAVVPLSRLRRYETTDGTLGLPVAGAAGTEAFSADR